MALKDLHEMSSEIGDVGPWEEFEGKLQDPAKRRVLYQGLSGAYGAMPTYEEFDANIVSQLPKGGIFGRGGLLRQIPRQFLGAAVKTGVGISDIATRLYKAATPEEIREPLPVDEDIEAQVKEEEEQFIASIKGRPVGTAGYIGATAGALGEFVAEMAIGGIALKPVTASRAAWMASKIPGTTKYGQLARHIVNKVATEAPVFTTVSAIRAEGGLEERGQAAMHGLKMSLVFAGIGAIPGKTLSAGTLARVPLGNYLLGTNPYETAKILGDENIYAEDKLIRLVDTAVNSWFLRKRYTKESLNDLHQGIIEHYRGKNQRPPEYITESFRKLSGAAPEQRPAEAAPVEALPAPALPRTKGPLVDEFTKIVGMARDIRSKTERLKHVEKQKRIREAMTELKRGEGAKAATAAVRRLEGEYPKAAFEPPKDRMTQEHQDFLYDSISKSPRIAEGFEKIQANQALWKVLTGVVPGDKEILLLQEVFGPAFAKTITSKGMKDPSTFTKAIDIAGIPRVTATAWDLSAGGRQALIPSVRHPIMWGRAFVASAKALLKEENAAATEYAILGNRYYRLSQSLRTPLQISPRGIGGRLSKHEEAFMSTYALKIPGIKASERAYVTMLNRFRMDYFAHYSKLWEGTGKGMQDYQDLAKAINEMTGRGTFEMRGEGGAILNAMFFSPRFIASRVQLPFRLLTSTPAVRKILAADLAAFVGAGVGVLTLASMVPGVEVQTDPRSSDFGKIRIGPTRVDFWAGYAPLSRFVAQMATQQRKSTGTGRIMDVEASELMFNYFRTKLSPATGLATDIIMGETMIGEEISTEPTSVLNQMWNRLAPFAVQDVAEAIKYQGLAGGFVAVPAFVGIGVQTYPETPWTKVARYKDMIANENFGMKWNELNPGAQLHLRNYFKEINMMEDEAKVGGDIARSAGYAVEEQEKAGMHVREQLPARIQQELESLPMQVSGLGRRMYAGWELNDKRYEEYQDTTAELLNITLPSLMDSPFWDPLTPEIKMLYIDEHFKRAKMEARIRILRNANRSFYQRMAPTLP